MQIMNEFKEFAIKGNVIELAVGIIIGMAFNKIVSSLVTDVIMPIIGLLIGGIDFSDFIITLKPASEGQGAIVIRFGIFLNTLIDFLIISFTIFIIIKVINSLKKKESASLTTHLEPSAELKILTEIRDLLRK